MSEKVDLNSIEYNKPFITRDIIKKELDDYSIYKMYINEDFQIGRPFSSPFRTDRMPSFSIFQNKDKELIYNDFVLGGGNVFSFVKHLFKLDSAYEVYSRIAIDFDLDTKYRCKESMIDPGKVPGNVERYERPKIDETTIKINIKVRPWKSHDKLYWSRYNIGLKTLQHYNVFAVDYIIFQYEKGTINKEMCIKAEKFAYAFLESKDGVITYKIYQPFSKNNKWLTDHDSSVWQGWRQLEITKHMDKKRQNLIITKSLKDVMAIVNNVPNVQAVALQSESTKPKDGVVRLLKKHWNNIFVLYDNDFDKKINHGFRFGKKIAAEHDLIFCFIPDHLKSKDFTDLIENHGKTKARQLLETMINTKGVPY